MTETPQPSPELSAPSTRSGLVGWMTRHKVAISVGGAVLALLIVGSIFGEAPEQEDASSASASPTPSPLGLTATRPATPAAEVSQEPRREPPLALPPAATPGAPVSPRPDTEAALAGCSDPAGDGQNVDLRTVKVTQSGKSISMIFTVTGTPPASGSLLWSVLDFKAGKQYGYKIVDSKPSSHFVFDFNNAQQQEVTSSADYTGGSARVTFPLDSVTTGSLQGSTAALNVNGDDVDECTLR